MAFSFLTGKRRSAKPDGVNQKQNGSVELDFGDGVNTANECNLPCQPYDAVKTEAKGIQTLSPDAAHFDKIARRTAEYTTWTGGAPRPNSLSAILRLRCPTSTRKKSKLPRIRLDGVSLVDFPARP